MKTALLLSFILLPTAAFALCFPPTSPNPGDPREARRLQNAQQAYQDCATQERAQRLYDQHERERVQDQFERDQQESRRQWERGEDATERAWDNLNRELRYWPRHPREMP